MVNYANIFLKISLMRMYSLKKHFIIITRIFKLFFKPKVVSNLGNGVSLRRRRRQDLPQQREGQIFNPFPRTRNPFSLLVAPGNIFPLVQGRLVPWQLWNQSKDAS